MDKTMNAAPKFTPGPYAVSPQAYVVGIAGEDTARSIVHREGPVTWVLAEWVGPRDAPLFAAAPEMYEALQQILAFDSMDYSEHIRGMQKIARAALAKVQ